MQQLEEFECLMFVFSHEGQGNLLGLFDKGQCLLKLACHGHVLGYSLANTINNFISCRMANFHVPYLPADRLHPRIGRTPNFPWFSWEKKNSEVEHQD